MLSSLLSLLAASSFAHATSMSIPLVKRDLSTVRSPGRLATAGMPVSGAAKSVQSYPIARTTFLNHFLPVHTLAT